MNSNEFSSIPPGPYHDLCPECQYLEFRATFSKSRAGFNPSTSWPTNPPKWQTWPGISTESVKGTQACVPFTDSVDIPGHVCHLGGLVGQLVEGLKPARDFEKVARNSRYWHSGHRSWYGPGGIDENSLEFIDTSMNIHWFYSSSTIAVVL